MTKENYMAMADFQTLWDDKLKPWINGQKADKSDLAVIAAEIGADDEFVDLGLPSGTLWARCNVGATAETGYGNYYKYGLGATQYDNAQTDYDGTEEPLAPSKDTASQALAAHWHMPTKAQIEELLANTTFSWQTNFNGSGVSGAKFTAPNGNYIFLPAAGWWFGGTFSGAGGYGYYWSATPNDSGSAYLLEFYSGTAHTISDGRANGFAIRGVKQPIQEQLDDRYTKAEVDNMALATMFRLYVDPEDMHLKGRNIQDGTFEVFNGHLILHQN